MDQLQDFAEDLTLEDEGQQGAIPWKTIMEAWKINKLPRLDDELSEFLFYLAMRNSETSQQIYIQKFLEVFDEDYLLTNCKLDDTERFDQFEALPDSHDLQAFNQQKNEEENLANAGHEEIMQLVEEAIGQIVDALPQE